MTTQDASHAQVVLAGLFGGLWPANRSLPERVTAAIAAQEDSSEVLIKIIQLAVVTIFGLLYAISPKTDAGTAFSPVPYILAAYLVFNLAGLAWSLTARQPDWAIYLSILFDMALLMALIVSFHFQYEQPASFSLKAPTLLYVFIFIALRTLRFEPRFVIAAGLAAAAGWLAMIAYVVSSDPEQNIVTRSYVEYMTGNAILIGAEFDKVITILTVTTVLALALKRGRLLLVEAVSEAAAARELSRFFDASVATRIRSAEQEIAAGEGVKREAAILYVDIRGFTGLAATLPPDAAMQLLAEYQARMVPVIQANGGVIDKFLGDGIMATFGAVHESERHAAEALATADAIVAAAAEWAHQRRAGGEQPLDINLSVASGPILFGAVGGDGRLEYTVIGAAVNLAAKLEKHNKAVGAVAITTQDTFERALAQGYVPSAKPRRIRGRVDGVQGVQRLVVLHAAAPKPAADSPGRDTR